MVFIFLKVVLCAILAFLTAKIAFPQFSKKIKKSSSHFRNFMGWYEAENIVNNYKIRIQQVAMVIPIFFLYVLLLN